MKQITTRRGDIGRKVIPTDPKIGDTIRIRGVLLDSGAGYGIFLADVDPADFEIGEMVYLRDRNDGAISVFHVAEPTDTPVRYVVGLSTIEATPGHHVRVIVA